MRPLFLDDDIFNRYEAIVESWMGTPFRHRQRCKGRGVDCAFLPAECLYEAGLMARMDITWYAHDWYACFKDNRVRDGLVAGLKASLNLGLSLVEMPPGTAPIRGDIVAFIILPAFTANHVAIMLGDDLFVHAAILKVATGALNASWRDRLRHVYRIFREDN